MCFLLKKEEISLLKLHNKLRSKQGASLVVVTVIFMVVVMMGGILITLVKSSFDRSITTHNQRQAHYTARSVMDLVIDNLNNPSTSEPLFTALSTGDMLKAEGSLVGKDSAGIEVDATYMGTYIVEMQQSSDQVVVDIVSEYKGSYYTLSALLTRASGNDFNPMEFLFFSLKGDSTTADEGAIENTEATSLYGQMYADGGVTFREADIYGDVMSVGSIAFYDTTVHSECNHLLHGVSDCQNSRKIISMGSFIFDSSDVHSNLYYNGTLTLANRTVLLENYVNSSGGYTVDPDEIIEFFSVASNLGIAGSADLVLPSGPASQVATATPDISSSSVLYKTRIVDGTLEEIIYIDAIDKFQYSLQSTTAGAGQYYIQGASTYRILDYSAGHGYPVYTNTMLALPTYVGTGATLTLDNGAILDGSTGVITFTDGSMLDMTVNEFTMANGNVVVLGDESNPTLIPVIRTSTDEFPIDEVTINADGSLRQLIGLNYEPLNSEDGIKRLDNADFSSSSSPTYITGDRIIEDGHIPSMLTSGMSSGTINLVFDTTLGDVNVYVTAEELNFGQNIKIEVIGNNDVKFLFSHEDAKLTIGVNMDVDFTENAFNVGDGTFYTAVETQVYFIGASVDTVISDGAKVAAMFYSLGGTFTDNDTTNSGEVRFYGSVVASDVKLYGGKTYVHAGQKNSTINTTLPDDFFIYPQEESGAGIWKFTSYGN